MTAPAYSNPPGIPASRTKVLACATVVEEMLPMMPAGMQQQVLEFGLHVLRFEEIEGASTLVAKLLFGPWDNDIVVCPPGQAITDELFRRSPAGLPAA